MNARRYRSSVRWIHLGLSAVLGTWIYSPWSTNAAFTGSIQWAVFPVLGMTGIALWQQARVLRLMGGRTTGYPTAPADAES